MVTRKLTRHLLGESHDEPSIQLAHVEPPVPSQHLASCPLRLAHEAMQQPLTLPRGVKGPRDMGRPLSPDSPWLESIKQKTTLLKAARMHRAKAGHPGTIHTTWEGNDRMEVDLIEIVDVLDQSASWMAVAITALRQLRALASLMTSYELASRSQEVCPFCQEIISDGKRISWQITEHEMAAMHLAELRRSEYTQAHGHVPREGDLP